MIYFLLFKEFDFTVKNYINGERAGRLKGHVDFLYYDDLLSWKELPNATYIFSDLDRLSPAQLTFTKAIWDQLESIDPPLRLLNNPHKVLQRYDLAKALYREGINQYQVWRASEVDQVDRFPVFLRMENDHTGSLTQLIETPEALHKALRSKQRLGILLHDLLIVQFLDTADQEGYFEKYGAFRIADYTVPKSIKTSKEWMVKHFVSTMDAEKAEAERQFVLNNPHEEVLKRVFDIAHIDYGRIDYSFLGDQLQVWEINVNPTVSSGRGKKPNHSIFAQFREARSEARDHFDTRFVEAFTALTCKEDPSPGIPVAVPASVRQTLEAEQRKMRWLHTMQHAKGAFFKWASQVTRPARRIFSS